MAGESCTNAEVEPGVDGGEAGVEALQTTEHAREHEAAGGGDAEHVGAVIVLRLVELRAREAHRATVLIKRLAESDQRL